MALFDCAILISRKCIFQNEMICVFAIQKNWGILTLRQCGILKSNLALKICLKIHLKIRLQTSPFWILLSSPAALICDLKTSHPSVSYFLAISLNKNIYLVTIRAAAVYKPHVMVFLYKTGSLEPDWVFHPRNVPQFHQLHGKNNQIIVVISIASYS